MTVFPVGKLPASLLQSLLERYVRPDPRVLVGPAVGQDATIIHMGDRLLVATSDPVTLATDEIGWYAVHINANDVACTGATPRWFLATVLLPEGTTTPELVEAIFGQVDQACRQLGVSLCGGHTEVSHDLRWPILVGQMLGEVAPDGYVTTAGARVGDVVILTKGFAIEGTALLALEKAAALRGILSDLDLARCGNLLHIPGISIVPEARLALQAGGVHALHDPTEGGLATGLWELAGAAGVGLIIEETSLPLLPECAVMCRHFGLDPLGLIASGSLLIAAAADRAPRIVDRLHSAAIAAATVGQIVPAAQGCHIRRADGTLDPLPSFARDEIARLFA
ncbi:MAG: hypothetical protein A2W31_14165 [Planctomycetes bacterium RBG_16_64_10]|nr:MAG: hypothetical protein A2W31_14165 [Planctomycetes bacterium RBG_16_64_10]